MSSNLTDELNAFQAFVTAQFSGCADLSLEQALREFREQPQWQPRTPLGQRLRDLRSQFIAEGGKLLDPLEVEAEARDRRGASFSDSTEK